MNAIVKYMITRIRILIAGVAFGRLLSSISNAKALDGVNFLYVTL